MIIPIATYLGVAGTCPKLLLRLGLFTLIIGLKHATSETLSASHNDLL